MNQNAPLSRWTRWAGFTSRHDRLLLGVIVALTIFFAFGLTKLQVGTNLKDFHRRDARELIETIEDNFGQTDHIAVLMESQTDQSMFTPELMHQQFRVMQVIKENFKVDSYSLVEGIDEGLRENKGKSILEVDDYSTIAEAIMALSGSRTVEDLARLSQNHLSHPNAIDFYSRFRIAAARAPSGLGASKVTYSIPYVKAVANFIQMDASYPPEDRQRIFVEMRNLVDSISTPQMKAYLLGVKLITYDMDSHTKKNALTMGLVLLILDGLLLWGTFRKRREVFFTLFIMLTSCIWTYGAAGWLGFRISFLHTMVLPILLGTGIDDCVVFGRRLAEERAKTKDFLTNLQATYVGTGTGIFLTTFTTFIAFAVASMASATQALFSFCLLVSISMAVDFTVTISLQGTLRSLLNRRSRKKATLPEKSSSDPMLGLTDKTHRKDLISRITNLIFGGLAILAKKEITKHSRVIFLTSGLLFLLALISMVRLDSDFDARLFMEKGMPSYHADLIEDKYFGNRFLGYVLIEGKVENPEILKKMRLLEKKMADYPLLSKIFGKAYITSVLDLIDKMRIPINPKTPMRSMLDQISNSDHTANFVTDESYRDIAEHRVHKTGDAYDGFLMGFMVHLRDREKDSIKVPDLYRDIKQEVKRLGFEDIPGVQVRIGGGDFSNFIEQTYYFKSFIWSFLISLLLNGLVLFFFWRRLGKSFMAVIPLILAVALTMGTMALFGVKLNVLNLCIGTIIVGLGVDYPIHIIERFDEERKKHPKASRLQIAQSTLSSMGPPLFGSALTTIVGFGSAMILAMPMAENFGFFTAFAILLTYLGSIFLLPVLLVGKEERGKPPLLGSEASD